MEYTKEDKETARNIVQNARYMELLEKSLVLPQEQWDGSVVLKSDAELGQLVKADVMAQAKIKGRFDELKRLAREEGTGRAPIAPE